MVKDKGVLIPDGDQAIRFQLDGPGAMVAVDNGDVTSHEPFQASERRAFQGRVIAIVRRTAPGGRIVVTASSSGLISSKVEIQ